MSPVLRWLVSLALFAASTVSHSSSIVFDKTSTDGYVDALCGASNTTCRAAAQKCYYQVQRARHFLADLNSSSVTLQDRCNRMRDRFDTCAGQASLNATWATITGSDRTCEGSFLRGGDRRSGHHKRKRAAFVNRALNGWSSYRDPHQNFEDKQADGFNYQRRQKRSRIFGRSSPSGSRGGSRAGEQHHFDDSQSTSRVEAFIDGIRLSNPDALQNYTRCMLRLQGLLSANDTVARDQFQMWATVAFATQPTVADVVKTAIVDCPEPVNVTLSDYMQCWGQACVEVI